MTSAMQLKLRVKRETANSLSKLKKNKHLRNKSLSRRRKILLLQGLILSGWAERKGTVKKEWKEKKTAKKDFEDL